MILFVCFFFFYNHSISGFRKLKKILENGPTFYSKLGGTVTVTFLILTLWLLCFSVSGLKMMIENEIFAVLALVSTALAGGRIVKIVKLPSLFGMLIIGLVWRNWNITSIDFATQISTKWGSIFRLIYFFFHIIFQFYKP